MDQSSREPWAEDPDAWKGDNVGEAHLTVAESIAALSDAELLAELKRILEARLRQRGFDVEIDLKRVDPQEEDE